MHMFKKRRGRKSKIDKMLEAASLEAMVRGGTSPSSLMSTASMMSSMTPSNLWSSSIKRPSVHYPEDREPLEQDTASGDDGGDLCESSSSRLMDESRPMSLSRDASTSHLQLLQQEMSSRLKHHRSDDEESSQPQLSDDEKLPGSRTALNNKALGEQALEERIQSEV